jgi:uncharacterized protein
MFRAVLDTNVIVSAAIKRQGMEAAALDLVIAGKAQLYVSTVILSEYEEVLRRPRFKLLKKEVDGIMRLITARAVSVKPGIRVSVSPDDDDNRFLECAAEAEAHYLVTGNSRHFPPVWKRTRIVTARQFVEILIDAERKQP